MRLKRLSNSCKRRRRSSRTGANGPNSDVRPLTKGIPMTQQLPVIYLARHGETAWTVSGQHTGLTDLPLTERGERNARSLGDRLRGLTFAKVYEIGRAHV